MKKKVRQFYDTFVSIYVFHNLNRYEWQGQIKFLIQVLQKNTSQYVTKERRP